jgi:hypothetical protein
MLIQISNFKKIWALDRLEHSCTTAPINPHPYCKCTSSLSWNPKIKKLRLIVDRKSLQISRGRGAVSVLSRGHPDSPGFIPVIRGWLKKLSSGCLGFVCATQGVRVVFRRRGWGCGWSETREGLRRRGWGGNFLRHSFDFEFWVILVYVAALWAMGGRFLGCKSIPR